MMLFKIVGAVGGRCVDPPDTGDCWPVNRERDRALQLSDWEQQNHGDHFAH